MLVVLSVHFKIQILCVGYVSYDIHVYMPYLQCYSNVEGS